MKKTDTMKKRTKTKPEGVVDPKIVAYAEAHSTPPSPARQAIRSESDVNLGEDAEMQLGYTGGSFLAFLAGILTFSDVLEVGTLNGGTTLAIAEKLSASGKITTLERDRRVLNIAKTFWAKSPHGKKIIPILGDAGTSLVRLEGSVFDMAFIDADKENYGTYWDLVLPLVRRGGIIVVDDVLCDGKIIRPRSKKVRSMHQFNGMVARDPRVEVIMLPMLDGLTLARKK